MEDDGNGISEMDNSIHNWYESVVFEKLARLSQSDSNLSMEQMSDIACVALNHLPPRYVRHTVDMSFYTSPQEKKEMENRVDLSILNAIEFVRQHPANNVA
ncbi:MAG: competence protein ComFB [Candidatus Azotimanducaceae bacterium]|jgi:competence protein ComFB